VRAPIDRAVVSSTIAGFVSNTARNEYETYIIGRKSTQIKMSPALPGSPIVTAIATGKTKAMNVANTTETLIEIFSEMSSKNSLLEGSLGTIIVSS